MWYRFLLYILIVMRFQFSNSKISIENKFILSTIAKHEDNSQQKLGYGDSFSFSRISNINFFTFEDLNLSFKFPNFVIVKSNIDGYENGRISSSTKEDIPFRPQDFRTLVGSSTIKAGSIYKGSSSNVKIYGVLNRCLIDWTTNPIKYDNKFFLNLSDSDWILNNLVFINYHLGLGVGTDNSLISIKNINIKIKGYIECLAPILYQSSCFIFKRLEKSSYIIPSDFTIKDFLSIDLKSNTEIYTTINRWRSSITIGAGIQSWITPKFSRDFVIGSNIIINEINSKFFMAYIKVSIDIEV